MSGGASGGASGGSPAESGGGGLDWGRVKEIFADAIERPAAARAEFVRDACGDDAALRSAVERMLRAHAEDETADEAGHGAGDDPSEDAPHAFDARARGKATTLDRAGESARAPDPAASSGPAPARPDVRDARGEPSAHGERRERRERDARGDSSDGTRSDAPDLGRIGPYRLRAVIGEGGFGVVYRARQTEPVEREVAVKVLKYAPALGGQIERYSVEVEALSRMEHPGIARVYDAGVTESGRPYVVMELVRGRPITQVCTDAAVDWRTRIDLVIRVCRALHHAHQRAVIHRDIKPSNVLVTRLDGRMQPRLIDFGVAQAAKRTRAATGMGSQTLAIAAAGAVTVDAGGGTAGAAGAGDRADGRGGAGPNTSGDASGSGSSAGGLAGTPRYMAPEQWREGGGDVRSDVYAIGILLCELLTGAVPRTPPGASGDRAVDPVQVERPSRLAKAAAERPASSETDGRPRVHPVSPAVLRGELDAIVLRAVAWEADHRYPSANALADDLARVLRREPVDAMAGGPLYRTRRFVVRHAVSSMFAAVALVALVAGVVVAAAGWQRAVAAREAADEAARRASFVTTYFLDEMIAFTDPDVAAGREVTVAQLLDVAGRTASRRFADDPELLAEIAANVGIAYERLGRPDQAVELLETALEAESAADSSDPARRLATQTALGMALVFVRGRHDEGIALLERTRLEAIEQLGADHPVAIRARLAWEPAMDDPEGSIVELEDILRALRAAGNGDGPDALDALHRLAVAHERLGQIDRALALRERSAVLATERLGDRHTQTITAVYRYGETLLESGRPDDGIERIDQAVARASEVFVPEHPIYVGMLMETVQLRLAAGRTESAVEAARSVERIVVDRDGPGSIPHGLAQHQLGQALTAAGDTGEAVEILTVALERRREHWGPDHGQVGATARALSEALAAEERWDEALQAADTALERVSRGGGSWRRATRVRTRALWMLGQPDRARTALDAAIADAIARDATDEAASYEALREELEDL